MYLKRLEIQGFKTFANHTILDFLPGTTAIVGPNGSGKSNLSEAIRWVLGEQSHNALRSKRTEDLIFNGGGKRAPSGLAEVSLTIDNSDRFLPLPYSEVTLTRRATRAGENEYRINRSRVRLRDIHEAIGPLGGSYTIINQGLVDAALTLSPDERRHLFEDAAEIGTLVSRKNEAQARLRETQSNVERCADVLAELEPRLRSLKRQASLARSYHELKQELQILLVEHYIQSWQAAQEHVQSMEAVEQQCTITLEQSRATQTTLAAELHETREAIQSLRERLGDLHSQSSELHTQSETVQRDLAVGTERLAALTQREEEAARNQNELMARREELDHERSGITNRLTAAEQRLTDTRAAVTTHETETAARAQTRRAMQQQLDAAQRAELTAGASLQESRRQQERIAAQRIRLTQEQQAQSERLAQTEAQLAQCRTTLEEAEARLAQATQGRELAVEAEEQARTNLEQLRTERSQTNETLSAARRTLADLEARYESLFRLQRSYSGTFAGVKAAMQWADTNKRQGFVLVSSIIQVPARLETAIEVALGARLQNIVVEYWSDAEDAIAALKKSGAGRATFLPIDTIRRATSDAWRPATDEVLGIAAILVEHEEHYRPVVQYLLGRTLVVSDISIARRELQRLSGGWTIVTLAGEQVNSGGAVTGGAQVKESGTLRRERELRELPDQIDEQQRTVAQHAHERVKLEERITQAEQVGREAETQRRRANQERDVSREHETHARREVERAETALETQRQRHTQVVTEIDGLDEQSRSLDAEQQRLIQAEQVAQDRLAQLRAEEQSHQEEDHAAQTHNTALRAAVAAVEGELRTERALLQAHDQQITRLEDQRTANRRRADEFQRERVTLETRMQELDTAQSALLAQIDELRMLINPAEEELDKLETNRTILEQREAEVTTRLLTAESSYSRATVEFQRAKDRLDTIWERAADDDIDIEQVLQQHETRASDDIAVNEEENQSSLPPDDESDRDIDAAATAHSSPQI